MYTGIAKIIFSRKLDIKLCTFIKLLKKIGCDIHDKRIVYIWYFMIKAILAFAGGLGLFLLLDKEYLAIATGVVFILGIVLKGINGCAECKYTVHFPFRELGALSIATDRKIYWTQLAVSAVYSICLDELVLMSVVFLTASILFGGVGFVVVINFVVYITTVLLLCVQMIPTEGENRVFSVGNGMLEICNVSYAYGEGTECVLENVSLQTEKSGVYIIEGENDSGRSAFLKMLAAIIDRPQGEISLCGVSLGTRDYKRLVGYIPDVPILYEELTGMEHIVLFMEFWEMCSSERNEYRTTVFAMARCLSLDKFMEQKVQTLSSGTRYKLFFVLMLARKPKLLLLDEPFGSLDIKSQEKAMDIIKKYSQEAIVILSSHKQHVIDALAERRYILENCEIKERE